MRLPSCTPIGNNIDYLIVVSLSCVRATDDGDPHGLDASTDEALTEDSETATSLSELRDRAVQHTEGVCSTVTDISRTNELTSQ
jgi:hypothetical protein